MTTGEKDTVVIRDIISPWIIHPMSGTAQLLLASQSDKSAMKLLGIVFLVIVELREKFYNASYSGTITSR